MRIDLLFGQCLVISNVANGPPGIILAVLNNAFIFIMFARQHCFNLDRKSI